MFVLIILPFAVLGGMTILFGITVNSIEKIVNRFRIHWQIRKLSSGFLAELSHVGSGRLECAICLDEFVCDDVIVTLQCTHVFHQHCFGEYLRHINADAACPLCRIRLYTQRKCCIGC